MQDSENDRAAQTEKSDLYIVISVKEPILSLEREESFIGHRIICKNCEIEYISDCDVFVFCGDVVLGAKIHLTILESDVESCGVLVMHPEKQKIGQFSAECFLHVSAKMFDRVRLVSGARLSLSLRPDECETLSSTYQFKFLKNPIRIVGYRYILESEVVGGGLR